MAQQNDTGIITRQASAALGEALLVRDAGAGTMALCGAANTDMLGWTIKPVLAANDQCAISTFTKPGTIRATVLDAIALHAICYAAASGKISNAGTVAVGYALQASTANGDIIEIIPNRAGALGTLARSSLTEDALQPIGVAFNRLRTWDAPGVNAVAATAANDDLAVVYNTFLTLPPTVEAGDCKTLTTTRKVGFQVVLPENYVAAGDVKIRVNAGMKTTVAGTSCGLDVEAARQAAPTADLVATAAQSMNNLVAANLDFVVTATNLTAGQILDVVVSIAIVDAATGTAVIPQINSITVLADVKG